MSPLQNTHRKRISPRPRASRAATWLSVLGALLQPVNAHASFLSGDALDTAANALSWAVLFIVPAVVIAVFWLVHILPEKIAEKRKHPQAKAIQCLCLLSLFFGGLLWPLAWLWAYSKPVLHKLAYGTDVDESHGHSAPTTADTEVARLRARVAELERAATHSGGKA